MLLVSAVCLYIYDHMTTFSDEVTFIWPAPWGAGKVLFLLTRYLPWPECFMTIYLEFFVKDLRTCHSIFSFLTWSILSGITLAEIILILRTWAIWDRRQHILLALTASLLMLSAALSYQLALYIDESTFARLPIANPSIPTCALVSNSRRIGVAWLGWTGFELVIVVMTLIKYFQDSRHCRSSSMIRSLYRDGIIYFIYIFAVSVANVGILYTTPAGSYTVLLTVMQRALHAILSCRIILHIRMSADKQVVEILPLVCNTPPEGHAVRVSLNGEGENTYASKAVSRTLRSM